MDSVGDVLSVAEMVEERRLLVDVAHRLLGCRIAAGSVVDEVHRRWYGLSEGERAEIGQPRSWLVTNARHVCPPRLAGPPDERSGTPGESAARWFRVRERVVQPEPEPECDDYDCPVCVSHSARTRHTRPTTQQHAALSGALRDACMAQATEALAALLAPDVSVFFDGGGKVRTLAHPVHGSRRGARSLSILLAPQRRTVLDTRPVNGRTGLVVRYDRQTAAVLTLDVAGSHVIQVWGTLNPDKLRSWNRPA